MKTPPIIPKRGRGRPKAPTTSIKRGYASTVTQLCNAVPMSLTWYYQLRRLPGAPVPCSNGKFSISEWRKFSKRKQSSVKPSEKADLELRCLRLKAERLEAEIDAERGAVRRQIVDELIAHVGFAMRQHRDVLERMTAECAPRFEGLSAMQIYTIWRKKLNEAFAATERDLKQRVGAAPAENVVLFGKKEAVA